ncbi:MAG: hypothetical protein Fur0010_01930 [Bdellovibrio sp.]
MSSLEITLRSLLDPNDKIKLFANIYEDLTSQKWATLLTCILKSKAVLEKNFCFMGLPHNIRNVDFLISELQKSVNQINAFNQKNVWNDKYFIKENYNKDFLLDSNGNLSRNASNSLHHHFEILHGPTWKLSPYVEQADAKTIQAIRNLNFICHELEQKINSIQHWKKNLDSVGASIICSFLGIPRFPLTSKDLHRFELDSKFGEITLHYAQVGKTHWDVFFDQDHHIFDETIQGLKYITGEFVINLWNDRCKNKDLAWKKQRENFHQWLVEKGLDPNDLRLGLGWIPVAIIDWNRTFANQTRAEILNRLKDYQDVFSIRVEHHGQVIEQYYPYSWNHSQFSDLISHLTTSPGKDSEYIRIKKYFPDSLSD